MNKQPTKTDWKRLYTAAQSFRDLAPWDWTDDDRIFGVKNPETGQIDYCGVLGALGEVFACVVYQGPEGLHSYLKLLSVASEGGPYVIEYQRALMASFENRSDLDSKDLSVIRSLKLKFRGKKAWPMFRHYLPGYMPWFLTAPQARTLAVCLEQALDVLPRYRENPDLLEDPESGRHLVRVYGDRTWHDEILPAPEPLENPLPGVPSDEVGLARIRRKAKKHYGTWEIGYGYAPLPIQERPENRPYFPLLLAIVDEENGMILAFELGVQEDHLPLFRDRIMSCLESMKFLPERLLVDHDETEMLAGPIAAGLGITLERVPQLPGFAEAIESMAETIMAP